mgnify:CR=1 FL=1
MPGKDQGCAAAGATCGTKRPLWASTSTKNPNYRDVIYSLTKDDLMAAAGRYLSPDALVIGIAGPERKAGG